MQVIDIAEWVASRRPPRGKAVGWRGHPPVGAGVRRATGRDEPGKAMLPDAADPIANRHRPEQE